MNAIKNILIFLAILFIGQFIIVKALETALAKSSFRFSKLYATESKLDNTIVCFGDSRAVHSFYSPFINNNYNERAFNFAYNGMKMPMVEIVLNDYLAKAEKPKKVFIEVSSVFPHESSILQGEGGYTEYNMYSKYSKNLSEKIKETDQKTHIVSSVFPLFRFNTEFLYRSMYYLDKSDQTWINHQVISDKLNEHAAEVEPFAFKINKENIAILNNIVSTLKAKDIEAHLYIAPYLPNYKSRFTNFDEKLNEAEGIINAEIHDYSDILTSTKGFTDRVHTNQAGAEILCKTLMEG